MSDETTPDAPAPLERDPLLLDAALLAVRHGQVHVASICGRLGVGAARARVLLQQLEDEAIIAPSDGRPQRRALLGVRDIPTVRRQLGGAS